MGNYILAIAYLEKKLLVSILKYCAHTTKINNVTRLTYEMVNIKKQSIFLYSFILSQDEWFYTFKR